MMSKMESRPKTISEMKKVVEKFLETFTKLKGKYECKKCGKKIQSVLTLFLSCQWLPPTNENMLCDDCLKDYIYELLKIEKERKVKMAAKKASHLDDKRKNR